jgi:hypothetical protein
VNSEKFIFDVAVGLVVALLSLVAKWQWPLIKSLFDAESRRQGAQISGVWKAIESFSGTNTQDTFSMEVTCRGGKVTGTHTCLTGPDEGKKFDIRGNYKDQVLTFAWMPSSREALESGTVTAKLAKDRRLEGHGLYIEPDDGKVYTSTFVADKQ